MKSLVRAYKSAKDNETQTGASPAVVPFQAELDEIFGDRPITGRSDVVESKVGEPLRSSFSPPPPVELTPTPDTVVDRPEQPQIKTAQRPINKVKKASKKAELLQLKLQYKESKLNLFNKKKELLLFLNAEKNKRHAELMDVLK